MKLKIPESFSKFRHHMDRLNKIMIKYISKYRSLLAVVFVLAPLLIWFACSELVQFTGGNEYPASPDYCEIVKAPQIKTADVSGSDLSNLKVDKSVCIHCVYDVSIGSIELNKSVFERFYIYKIYLFNNVFLI